MGMATSANTASNSKLLQTVYVSVSDTGDYGHKMEPMGMSGIQNLVQGTRLPSLPTHESLGTRLDTLLPKKIVWHVFVAVIFTKLRVAEQPYRQVAMSLSVSNITDGHRPISDQLTRRPVHFYT